MFDLDSAIAHWRQQMFAAGIKTPATLDELENHLREEIGQQIRAGLNNQQAFAAGIRQIGECGALKREFSRVGGTQESQLRKLMLTVAVLNMVFGAFSIYLGCHSLPFLWFCFTHHVLFDPGDLANLCRVDCIGVYGSIIGLLAIVAAVRIFRWQHSGLTLMTACSWLTILGVLVDEGWRVLLDGFHMNLVFGIFLCPCLLYPSFLLALGKNPSLKKQYV
jgi:hypothetical protein